MDSLTVISGNTEDNILTGTDGTDILLGMNGDDALDGGDGNDLLLAGNGDDLLDGGSGNDLLLAGNGDDLLDGGDGNDVLLAGNGDDQLDGGAGSDIVFAGKGDDTLNYTLSENLGETDYYDGGKDFDTLQLTLTYGEQLLAQTDIDNFQAFLASGVSLFQFQSFDLVVRNIDNLSINNINTAPTAQADAASTDEDTVLVIPASALLANDTDPDNLDILALTSADAVSALGATVKLGLDGSLSYDPTSVAFLQQLAQGATATDSFNYTIEDLAGATSTATVNVTVTGVNDAPVAAEDSNTTDEDTPVTSNSLTNLLANDSDVDAGDVLRVGAVNGDAGNVGHQITLASGALLTVNEDGSYSYDPNGQFESLGAGESAIESFTYVAIDSLGEPGDTATVNLTITGVDDAPAGEIRVAVVGGSQIFVENNNAAAQLADSTAFNFDVSRFLVNLTTTKDQWFALLSSFDVVVIGENGGTSDYDGTQVFAALREFVDLGGGVITTGVFAGKIEAYTNATTKADADYISPAALNPAGTGSQFAASGSTITISNPFAPITGDLPEYTAQGLHEVAAAVDDVNKILAVDSSGRAAIAYDDAVGLGRTVFLGSIHMAASSPPFVPSLTRTGDVDKIFEQAVAWAAGDTSTILLAASATSLESAPAGGEEPSVDQFYFGEISSNVTASSGEELFLEVNELSFNFDSESATQSDTDTSGGTFVSFEESLYAGLDQPLASTTADADTLL